MKTLSLLAVIIALFAQESFAHETPAARLCRSVGGTPWTLDSGNIDDLQICLLGGSIISAESLRIAVIDGFKVEAVQDYADGIKNCRGKARVRRDTNNNAFNTCEFSDGSAIGLETLNAGKESRDNWRLNNLLNL